MKVQTNNNNFTSGEFTPRLRGRSDLEKYNSSASALENMVVLRHGGATKRPSRDYLGEVKNSTDGARLIEFVFSRVDSYVLEFGNLYMRVWKNGAVIGGGTPYEVATPWTIAQVADLDYAQGGDTLIVVHPSVAPQRIQRIADNNWTVGAVPFDPPALEDQNGTPAQACTPSAASPIGGACSLTLAAAGWVAGHVGSHVEINGGLVKITAFSSSTVVNGIILRVLASTTAAPVDAWSLREPVWTVANGYPSTVTFHQQRLWLGGSLKFPQSKWGSKSGLYYDFTSGTEDDAAVYKTINSDEVNIIQYLVNNGQLVTLTYGAEFTTRGGVEKPVTQLNAQIDMQSKWGTNRVRSQVVGRTILAAQRGGKALRAYTVGDYEALNSRDVSVYSEHLLRDGIKSMAFEQDPEHVLWIATNTGKLLAFTFNEEQNIAAMCSANHEGAVEWLANIPEGDTDATYCITRYTINGVTKRYIERINWAGVKGQDARRTMSGASATVWAVGTHLEGKVVSVQADGVDRGLHTVTGGNITLQRAATSISYGLPYKGAVRLRPQEVGTGTGTAQAQATRTNKVWAYLLETIGCKVDGKNIPFRKLDRPELNLPVEPFTGFKELSVSGWDDGDGVLEISSDQPYPFTLLFVVRSLTVNAK